MVRACLALLAGRWAEAWALHPLAFAAVPVGALEVAWLALPRLPRWRYPRAVLALAAVALLGTWAFRLATGTHPDGLAWHRGAVARALGYVAPP